MFVFGVNLPVAEILFVVLLLFIVALVIIIVQLGRMARHVRVLDQTTLEIRRYEEAEEVTLRALEHDVDSLSPAAKKRVQSLATSVGKTQAKALSKLLSGHEPASVKSTLIMAGVPEGMATRAVNNAGYWLDRTAALDASDAKHVENAMKQAAK